MSATRQPDVRVLVNGCELYHGRVAAGRSLTLSLKDCPSRAPFTTIEVLSEAFRPPRDERTLGVGLSSVTLIAAPDDNGGAAGSARSTP